MSGFGAVALPLAIGLQGVSAISSAQAQQQDAASAAAEFNFNAGVERERQGLIRSQGLFEERQQRRLARLMLGEKKTQLAGSGFALTGQRADILAQDAVLAELDALQIRENTRSEIRASQQQETIDRFRAKQTIKQGRVSAGATILGGLLGGTSTYLGARGLG